ncbi:MAG: Uncharacterised protein [Synechococcus sp. MIT S9220]|nr:MAG: Uncharacterised protein [Synechococcus sp. MIT S9220]
MQRLALFKHHEVGDIDDGVDGLHSGTSQSLLQPLR